jgi:hypothetical protein
MWMLALALLAAAAPETHGGVDVHAVAGGRVDVRATAAPLSEVLDRLSAQTGMKVEGPRERQLVTATLVGRTPAEAVLGILDGLGVNYALILDPTGKQVQTLLISGAAPVSSGGPSASPAPAAAARPERSGTSWDDTPEVPDEADAEELDKELDEPAKAGNPFVPQEGANGRPVKRPEGGQQQQQQAAPAPSPQASPSDGWQNPAPQPLALPTPAPAPTTPTAAGQDDFFDDQ